MIQLLPIKQTIEENQEFNLNPACHEALLATIDYYKIISFNPPWIGYFVKLNGVLVGSAGFKGKPIENKIEIAYGTFAEFKNKGIGTEICRQLVLISQKTDPAIIITARTLQENKYSSRILQKNNFKLLGTVVDKDDGEVLEWQHSLSEIG